MTGTPLDKYSAKRKFDQTPEPQADVRPKEERLRFVIHKHAARALHYDIRLELEGVLKSWACPKGPSLDPKVRRLAVQVEDHPLDYKDFEGVIPEGNYGAGGVIIWDRGFYRHPLAKDEAQNESLLLEGLKKGDLKFILEGQKLNGEFALVKTKADEKSWLLLKKKDKHAGVDDVLSLNRSVASGKSLEDLMETGREARGTHEKAQRMRLREALEGHDVLDAPIAPLPHRVQPMLAATAKAPFDDPDWLFEIKWDGYRAIGEARDGESSLYSRNLLPLEDKFATIAQALRDFGFNAVFDGEVVAVDDKGQADFGLLQDYPNRKGHLLYYVFDLLHFEGHDLTGIPLVKRKEILKKILPASPKIRFSDHVIKDGALFFKVAKDKGLEGIVAKHGQSLYLPGKRSGQWLKIKATRTIDAIIAGFTAPRGSRKHFGTLVLGVYRKGELVCIGHSGGGFKAEELEKIHGMLLALVQAQCPFAVAPQTAAPPTWVKPQLVCEVAFTGWTKDGLLRHPVFLRLRDDKHPLEVTLEGEAP